MELQDIGDERFTSKVSVDKSSGCWNWLAGKSRGYGMYSVGRVGMGAHRYAWEVLVGPIDKGLELDHYRMNPGARNAPCSKSCVNPGHLEAVTHAENMKRADLKGWPRISGLDHYNGGRTHCIRGHEFSDANTYVVPGSGKRMCRACQVTRRREWRRARRAKGLSAP